MDYKTKERILKNMLEEITKKYDYIMGDYKALEAQYSERLTKDYLTNLLNREGFYHQSTLLMDRIKSQNITDYGVLMIDIDNFKYINNFYGREIGDVVLQEIARLVSDILPKNSIMGRVAGDRFAFFIYDINEEEFIDVSNKLKENIDELKLKIGDSLITISISIGASFSNNFKSFDILWEEALNALSEAKQKGKNTIVFFNDGLQQKSENLMQGRTLALKALEEKDGVIAYIQPIVETVSKKIIGGELLMRLNLDGKIYTPYFFLESALYFNLIDKLEHRFIEFVSKLNFKENLTFFLNKSITRKEKIKVVNNDIQLLKNIKNSRYINFVIEITENSIFENMTLAKDLINNNKETNFAIDDFGSGYTSLGYIHELDIKFLKIDGSMVKAMNTNSKVEAIVKGIVDMSKAIGIKTVAEFIEAKEDHDRCLRLGIDYCQGYYFYKPMPFNEFENLVK